MSLLDISEFHILFEIIHPFTDGNGRVGRLIMAYQAIQNNIVPPLIENEARNKYLKALDNKTALLNFIDSSIENSMKLLK
jgi:Fic family protein